MTPQSQSLNDYGVGETKTVSDLIGENVTIQWTGTNGKVMGDIKKIDDPWTDFSLSDNTGHFFPVELDEQYEGERITAIGARQKTVTDRKWVLRVENAKSNKFTFKKGSDTLFVLDFSEATLK